ncbi:MAG: hypothetical protein CL693_13600 [Cellvibrionaceae bacterium]|nr:hypothetical protein [Cellvibrionaceae bacterium]MAZ88669.1 hypothetical protein [Cellvibrionaceae bacterium]|tara:strand:- start:3043 stop:3357 length:315 start_codon:yes stop_codon:yes gene_type:complete
MTIEQPSKTKTSFYRRLYVAHLIATGIHSVPAITAVSGMPRRTTQDTIANLKELDIDCEFIGGTKNGHYRINDWGPISQNWVKSHFSHIAKVLDYPATLASGKS